MELYKRYRTRTFSEIFDTVDNFKSFYTTCGIPGKFTGQTTIDTLYYLLLARYANSAIASSDENRFKFQTMSIIFQYGPTWEKRLSIQDSVRALTEDDILTGSTAIFNHALHDGTAPSTDTSDELDYINEQNVTKYKKAKVTAYGELMELLEMDVTGIFLDKFKPLFSKFPPEIPIIYASEEEEEGEEEND